MKKDEKASEERKERNVVATDSSKGEKPARRRRKGGEKMEMVQFAWLGHISPSPIAVEADGNRDKAYLESGRRDSGPPFRSSLLRFHEAKFEFRIVLRNPTHA